MVGLVFVSHSRTLAEALVSLVGQIAVGQQPAMAVAAGVGTDRQEFGTDAVEIAEAIQAVSTGEGVVVLMDLGSAILSAETALDLLPESLRAQVRLSSAPFVEGAIAAAVQASLGSSLEVVSREAEQALLRKSEQLGQPGGPVPETPGVETPAPQNQAQELALVLTNAQGLHARPAARFVQTAAGFQADIQVRNLTEGKGPVSARSLLGVISLGAVKGHKIGVTASGPEAAQALEAISLLVTETLPELPGG